MIGGNKPHGYTIVETLLFLAISSLMFLMSAAFISGKQSAVEFKQGTNNINAQIRSVVNDVTNGQYPPAASFRCTATAGNPPVFTTIGAVAQGTNGGCIFLGKVVQFNVAADPAAYNIYTVAARQTTPAGTSVSSFLEAKPAAVSGAVDLTEKKTLEHGLIVKKVLKCTGDCAGTNGVAIGSFGFFGSLGNYGLSQSSTPESGAQTIVTASIPSSSYGETEASAAVNIGSAKDITSANIVGNGTYILLCFENGNKKASLNIGGESGQQFTTTLETGQGISAAC